jgi:hypothetical protein
MGKVVMCGVFMLGKHRDLPKDVDPAVYLPSLLNDVAYDGLDQEAKEDEPWQLRVANLHI